MDSSCRELRLTERARAASTHLAVDEGRGDDQEPLKDVLPLLIEVEKYRRVQDLNDEPRTHERTDEGASPTEQARAAEDDGGDRRQGVPGALSGAAHSELREQDNRAEEGEERGAHVAEERCP